MLKKLPSLRDEFREISNVELEKQIAELKKVEPKRSSKKKQEKDE